jgi:TonB family protein
VLPDVSAGGRRSIHGKIAVRVKVTVDAAGNVAKAKLESGRASSYFKRVAMEAARDWKFSPAASGGPSREWKLEFDFTRAKTEASAEPVQR